MTIDSCRETEKEYQFCGVHVFLAPNVSVDKECSRIFYLEQALGALLYSDATARMPTQFNKQCVLKCTRHLSPRLNMKLLLLISLGTLGGETVCDIKMHHIDKPPEFKYHLIYDISLPCKYQDLSPIWKVHGIFNEVINAL